MGAIDFDKATRQSEELIQLGVNAKRAHKYDEALRFYESAQQVAPWYLHVYYALGKIHYLKNDKAQSLLSYTIAAHLHLGLGPAINLDPRMNSHRKTMLASYPQPVVDLLHTFHPEADLLVLDTNTPRHLGHSLTDLDLDGGTASELHQEAQAYRQSISGSFYAQLHPELEEGFYHWAGVYYLLFHIKWEEVGRCPAQDVYRLYKSSEMIRIPEDEGNRSLKLVGDMLRNLIALRPATSLMPYSDLQKELFSVWKAMDANKTHELNNIAKLALQAIEVFLGDPVYSPLGLLNLSNLVHDDSYRPLMTRRWTSSTRLVQTPVTDILFKIHNQAERLKIRIPVLKTIVWVIKQKELVNLRNNLVHSSYKWGNDGTIILHAEDGTALMALSPQLCETFHALICVCSVVLESFLKGVLTP